MKSIKCSNCGLINFDTQTTCKRCNFSLSKNNSEKSYGSRKAQDLAFAANRNFAVTNEPEDVKNNAWKKIKWGLIISIIGFTITFGAINLGVFQGYENADREYLTRVKAFSFITLLPLSAVLAGIIELISGVSIFKIIEKWEELPQWLGWTIGISVFLLIITVIMVVAVIVIFNFF